MINVKKLMENLQLSYPKPILEHSFVELDNNVDPARKARASGLGAFYQYLDESSDGHASTHWKVQSASEPTLKYDAVVEIVVPTDGGLFALASGRWEPKKFKPILTQSDVRVHCNCPDFYWAGMMHNVGPNGKYKGALAMGNSTLVKNAQSSPSAPVIRNPSGNNTMCKHLHSIFKVFPSNAFEIMSAARKFNNKTKIDTEKTEKVNSNEIPVEKIKEPEQPEKGKPRQIPEAESKPLLDSLYAAGEQLNKDIQNGATDMINNSNDVAETEANKEETPTEPVNNIIQDQTIEEEPIEPESVNINDVVNADTDEDNQNEPIANNILSEPDENKINKNIKPVSVDEVMNSGKK